MNLVRRVGAVLSRAALIAFVVALAVLPIPIPPLVARKLRPKQQNVPAEVLRERR